MEVVEDAHGRGHAGEEAVEGECIEPNGGGNPKAIVGKT